MMVTYDITLYNYIYINGDVNITVFNACLLYICRFHTYHSSHEYETCAKVQYVYNRIRHCVQVVGSESHLKYYWLFPIVVVSIF